jgi:hypothetical protein
MVEANDDAGDGAEPLAAAAPDGSWPGEKPVGGEAGPILGVWTFATAVAATAAVDDGDDEDGGTSA